MELGEFVWWMVLVAFLLGIGVFLASEAGQTWWRDAKANLTSARIKTQEHRTARAEEPRKPADGAAVFLGTLLTYALLTGLAILATQDDESGFAGVTLAAGFLWWPVFGIAAVLGLITAIQKQPW